MKKRLKLIKNKKLLSLKKILKSKTAKNKVKSLFSTKILNFKDLLKTMLTEKISKHFLKFSNVSQKIKNFIFFERIKKEEK